MNSSFPLSEVFRTFHNIFVRDKKKYHFVKYKAESVVKKMSRDLEKMKTGFYSDEDS